MIEATQAIMQRGLLAVCMAVGGGLVATARPLTHQQLCTLISYAAGALLIVTLSDSLPLSYRMIGFLPMVIGAVTGYGVFALITRYFSHVCPACAASHTETMFRRVTWAMVAALSVHCVLDGLALAASWGQLSGDEGFALAAAVLLHKVPEGLALAAVARGAGWPRMRALGLVIVVETATTLCGMWAGLSVGVYSSEICMGWVAAHVGGGFLYLAGHAMVNELARHQPRSTAIAAGLGMITIVALQMLFAGHGNIHGH